MDITTIDKLSFDRLVCKLPIILLFLFWLYLKLLWSLQLLKPSLSIADRIMLLHPLMKVPTHTKSKEKCVCKLSLVFVLSFCFYLKILWLLKLLRPSLRIANHIMLIDPLIKVPTHTKAWREKMNAEGLNLYTSFVFDLFPPSQAPLFLQSKPHLLHHHHQYLRTRMRVYFILLF